MSVLWLNDCCKILQEIPGASATDCSDPKIDHFASELSIQICNIGWIVNFAPLLSLNHFLLAEQSVRPMELLHVIAALMQVLEKAPK